MKVINDPPIHNGENGTVSKSKNSEWEKLLQRQGHIILEANVKRLVQPVV